MGPQRGAFFLFVISVVILPEPRVIIDDSQAYLWFPVAIGALPRAIPSASEIVSLAGLNRVIVDVTVFVADPTQVGAHFNFATQNGKGIIGLTVPQVVAVLGVSRVDRLVAVGGCKGDGSHVVRCSPRVTYREGERLIV